MLGFPLSDFDSPTSVIPIIPARSLSIIPFSRQISFILKFIIKLFVYVANIVIKLYSV
nr:MAG TPA: hypothetical protein [Caudoviricetes sp.]DAQ66631.1 MAG TPA: hypothetical protein [Caudoviricetes sp.]